MADAPTPQPTATQAADAAPAAPAAATVLNAAVETAVATTPGATPTEIGIFDQRFELKNMSVEDGERLYRLIEEKAPDYKPMADAYANLAKRFQRKLDIELPNGMSFATAWENTINAAKRAGGIPVDAADYQKKIYETFKDDIEKIPGVGTAANVAETASSVAGAGGAAVGGAWNTLLLLPRALGSAFTIGGEVVNSATGALAPISDGQARAFGAAMAGSAIYEGSVRKAMPFIDMPFNGVDSQVFEYPTESLGAAWDYAILNIPLLKDIAPYIQACFNMVMQWASVKEGQPKKSFSDFVKEAQQSAEEARTNGGDTYQGLAERRMRAGETERAAGRVREAKVIADVDVAPVVDVAENGTPFQETDGTASQATPDAKGLPTVTPVTEPDGTKLTTWDRIKEAAYAPVKPLVDGAKEHPITTTVGAAGGAALIAKGASRFGPGAMEAVASGAQGVAQGIANGGRGALAGYMQGSADVIGGKPVGNAFATSHSMLNKLDRLELSESKALARVKELEAHTPKGGLGVGDRWNKIKLGFAENRWEKIAEKVETLKAKIPNAPSLPGGVMAEDALKISDKAQDVMGAAGGSRIGQITRSGGRLLGRFAPWLTAGFAVNDTVDGVKALNHGDGRAATESFTSVGSVATGAAVGAGIGVWAFGVGAIPGAIIGSGVAGIADFAGGFFGYGAKDIGGKAYDYLNPEVKAQQIRQAQEAAKMQKLKNDPEIRAFCEAVVARDPEAMQILMGNNQVAANAQLALKACGVVITNGALPASGSNSRPLGAAPRVPQYS